MIKVAIACRGSIEWYMYDKNYYCHLKLMTMMCKIESSHFLAGYKVM